MPINIPDKLPATEILRNENIFVMNESAARRQDIRPLRIAILNLMPLKIATEIQLLRMMSNTPLQVEIELVMTGSYQPQHTPRSHLDHFYKTFPDIISNKYDGMIITGAPVEHIPFEEVAYWDEIVEIFRWVQGNVTSTLFICWAAQAALHFYYGIPRHTLPQKLSGVYRHTLLNSKPPIVRGFDDEFYAPHSRHTGNLKRDIECVKDLDLIADSEEAGPYLVAARNKRKIFVTGHSEYDADTLKLEYERDLKKSPDTLLPQNYFPENKADHSPIVRWRGHSNLLFSNWLNYYVYQETPYDIHEIREKGL